MSMNVANVLIISLPITIGIRQSYGVNEWQNAESIVFSQAVNFLILGLAVVSFLMLFLIYNHWRRRLMSRMLSQKNQEIEDSKIREREKNREILAIQEMVEIQEAERINIAKDLHDGLGGLLSSVKMQYAELSHAESSGFSEIEALIDESCNELRRVAHDMMPDALMKFGLVNALEDLAGKLETDGKLTINIQAIGMNYRLESSTEIAIYRIILELLNNVIEQADASDVLIQLAIHDDQLNIIVEDDGSGLEQVLIKGIGLKKVESRVSYLNGKIEYDSYDNSGTTVTIDIPV